MSEVREHRGDDVLKHACAVAQRAGLDLRFSADGTLVLAGDGMELCGDFSRMLPRVKQGRLQQELLVRAARLKGVEHPTAVDATAGLGEDSFLLAAAGFEVTLFEHNPVTAALLRDALSHAGDDPRLAEVAGRMRLVEADSVAALPHIEPAPDLVLLDPMFPAKQKSGIAKKKLQMLQRLELPCAAEEELLEAALSAGPRKVVIKRPLKGPHLAGKKPSYTLEGKVIRYDCLVLPRS